MAVIDFPDRAQIPSDLRSKIVAFLAAALGLAIVLAVALFGSPIDCTLHRGSFSAGFSADFDIDHLQCRLAFAQRVPAVRFYSVTPYVVLIWPDEAQEPIR